MPHVRIVLEDDNGNSLPETEQVYALENDCDTLNQIEAAVETFRKQALPTLEQSLLTQAQARCITQEKKTQAAS
jgi:hypothetical protein